MRDACNLQRLRDAKRQNLLFRKVTALWLPHWSTIDRKLARNTLRSRDLQIKKALRAVWNTTAETQDSPIQDLVLQVHTFGSNQYVTPPMNSHLNEINCRNTCTI
jgi:hypothetical protein